MFDIQKIKDKRECRFSLVVIISPFNILNSFEFYIDIKTMCFLLCEKNCCFNKNSFFLNMESRKSFTFLSKKQKKFYFSFEEAERVLLFFRKNRKSFTFPPVLSLLTSFLLYFPFVFLFQCILIFKKKIFLRKN